MAGGITFSIELKGQKAVRALRYLANLGEHPEPLLDVLGAVLVASTERRFDEGRAPGGTPWPVSRRVALHGGKTLVKDGLLASSIRHEVHPNAVEVGVDGASESTKFAYVHQFGATIVPVHARALAFIGPDGHTVFARKVVIPARPFLGVDKQDRADAGEAMTDYVRERLQ